MSAPLAGQRAVVVGGGSGAGLASAKRLASLGADVIITGRSAAKLEAAKRELGGAVTVRAVDGKDVAATHALFDELGAIDHVVLTAGETNPAGLFKDGVTDAKFRDTFDGKFWVQVNAAHAAAPHVRPGGTITFFSGGAAHRAMAGMVNIAAVNGAIEAVVPVLALELAPTRVNAISPGTLATTYWTGVPEDRLQEIFGRVAKALPAGRVGTGEDVATAVEYLVRSSFVTGTVLRVDGGLPLSSL